MKAINTTNYNFLKNFRPELYKLAVKMEADLLIAPISILSYGTRFLEYILYDIARLNNYKVNKDSGFVNNIYELIQLGYLEFYLGDLLIKAYVFRNTSIHNTEITKALKNDKKDAFELNKRLFDIADVYYKNLTNDYEDHPYIEPNMNVKSKKESFSTIIKQEKNFNNCIICGESTIRTKSNFCTECDNLLNYREVLTKIITKKGTNVLLNRDDFDYGLKDQLIKDLINQGILEKVGNNYNIVNDELDKYYKVTDEFMEVDKFLQEFTEGHVKDPLNSEFYLSNDYPYSNVSNRINEFYIAELISIMENGFSQKYALEQIDVTESNLNYWYEDKKSDFVNGNKDRLFIQYNKLLIKDLFRLIEKGNPLTVEDDMIEFWSKYFTGFSEKLSKKLIKQKLKAFVELFKGGHSKREALSQVELTCEEFDEAISIHKVLADEYYDELEKRECCLLDYLKENSLAESLKKSNMELDDCISCEKLTEILQDRYLNYRLNSLSTSEACEKLTVAPQIIKSWFYDDIFMKRYAETRLNMFRNGAENYKSKSEILNDLEITNDELNEYISRGKSGEIEFIDYYDYFENVYYENRFRKFLVEFRKKKNLNMALKSAEVSQTELDDYLQSHDKYQEEFLNLKISFIVDYIVKKGKITPKMLKKTGLSKNDYRNLKSRIDRILLKKQVQLLTEATINDEIIYFASKEINCDWRDAFDWIYRGSCGDELFEKLADEYWLQAIRYINQGNSLLRKGESIGLLKRIIDPKPLGEYDLKYWQKWGLMDKNNVIRDIEDIKNIIKKNA